MKWEVEFSDTHIEVVDAPDRTIAELTAVSNHRGYSFIVQVRPHQEMVDLDPVPRGVLDYIQRVYDELPPAPDPDTGGWRRGVEFVVLQLGLPIKLGH